MMTTTSTPGTTPVTTPSSIGGTDPLPHEGSPRLRSRGAVIGVTLAVLAISGPTVWITSGVGADDRPAPVQIVEDGRWGGPDVYEHGRPAPVGIVEDGRWGGPDVYEHGRPAPVGIVEDGRWGGPDVHEHGRPAPEGLRPRGADAPSLP